MVPTTAHLDASTEDPARMTEPFDEYLSVEDARRGTDWLCL